LSRDASCNQAHEHVAKRIVFVVVALNKDALATGHRFIDHNRTGCQSRMHIGFIMGAATLPSDRARRISRSLFSTDGGVRCDSECRLAGYWDKIRDVLNNVCFLTIDPIKSRVHCLSEEHRCRFSVRSGGGGDEPS